MRRLAAVLVCAAGLGMAVGTGLGQQVDAGRKCAELGQLKLEDTTIVSAELVAAGMMTAPTADDKDPVYARMPAICRVKAESHPSNDSKIAIEVWLPAAGWNGRFLGTGNGGFAGQIGFHYLAAAATAGYASAGTDTGHSADGLDARWALGHPEKIKDFGWRGVHEMSVTGEAIAHAFYGRAAEHRYFNGCSDGGREALMEAQRFPGDYDGIVAGAPAYHWTRLVPGGLYVVQGLEKNAASYVSAAKLPAISKAILEQCKPDAVGDFLDDPAACRFDAAALLCRGKESDACLTAPEVKALAGIYSGPKTRGGEEVNYRMLPGAELGQGGWGLWVTGAEKGKGLADGFVRGYFRDMVYSDEKVNVLRLDPDKALAASAKNGEALDAVNADLGAFAAHGGKLILYHGWNDPAIPSLGTIDYYGQVVKAAGSGKAGEFVRLFLAPGMQHCGGGPGPTEFGQGGPDGSDADDAEHSVYRALEAWVEAGKAPEKLIARKSEEKGDKPAAGFTRPLCAYPKAAVYGGSGDRRDAANYSCAASQ